MKKLTVKYQDSKFRIISDEKLYGEIIFDENNIDASLHISNKILRAEKGPDKNIELRNNNKTLFKFVFDYIWGGAEISSNGEDTGFDIKGRWFRPGTRLTDKDDKDLIIAVKKNDGLDVSILDENIAEEMVLATIYYHLYSSRGKMLAVIIGSVS